MMRRACSSLISLAGVHPRYLSAAWRQELQCLLPLLSPFSVAKDSIERHQACFDASLLHRCLQYDRIWQVVWPWHRPKGEAESDTTSVQSRFCNDGWYFPLCHIVIFIHIFAPWNCDAQPEVSFEARSKKAKNRQIPVLNLFTLSMLSVRLTGTHGHIMAHMYHKKTYVSKVHEALSWHVTRW